MKNRGIEILFSSLLSALLFLTLIQCIDKVDPTTGPAINLMIVEDNIVYPNHDTIHFVLERFDNELEIAKIEILVNDSLVIMPASFQNWESPNTYASYYWYETETLPIGIHTIKALVYDAENLVTESSITIEIEDFREKYYGDYHYVLISGCDDTEINSFDGWIKEFNVSDSSEFHDAFSSTVYNDWSGHPPLKRRMTIHFANNEIVTPVFYAGNDFDGFNHSGSWVFTLGGEFPAQDTIEFSFVNGRPCGRYGRDYTSVTGIRK